MNKRLSKIAGTDDEQMADLSAYQIRDLQRDGLERAGVSTCDQHDKVKISSDAIKVRHTCTFSMLGHFSHIYSLS